MLTKEKQRNGADFLHICGVVENVSKNIKLRLTDLTVFFAINFHVFLGVF